jgi:hypothetical protein
MADTPQVETVKTDNKPAGVMPPAPSAAPAAPRKRLPKWLLAILAAVVLLIGAVAYALVVAKSPEEQIQAAIAKSVTAESASFEGDLTVAGAASAGVGSLRFSGEGNSDAAEISLTIDAGPTTLTVDIVVFENEFFFKVKGLKGLSALAGETYAPLVSQLETLDDTFIVINQSMLSQLGLPVGQTEQAKLSDADLAKLAELVEKANFFTVTEKLGSKDINGSGAKGYRVKLDRQGLLDFLSALESSDISGIQAMKAQVTTLREALQGSDQADFDKLSAEIWLQGGRVGQIVISGDGDGGTTTVTLTFTSYDQPVSIERPKSAKSLLEVIAQLQEGLGQFFPPSGNQLTPGNN